jgi:hypothetical protein
VKRVGAPGATESPTARRVRRLLRWYPRSWRDRYGDEFAELLLAEMSEQPASVRRTADVIRSGLLARLTLAGLTSHELPPQQRFRACLGTLSCAIAVIGTLGVFMLAQLATGWQWAATSPGPAAIGTVIMTVAVGCLALTGLAAAVPAGWYAVRTAIGRRDAGLALAIALASGCLVVLVTGTRHFQNGWPGTGGTGPEHALVPAGLAAFGWASTLSVSAYWAHPGVWGVFPAAELAWMVLSPLAWAGALVGVAGVARRLDFPVRLQAYMAWLGAAATIAGIGLVGGAAWWALARGQAEDGLFRPGLIDLAGLGIMATAAVVALRSAAMIQSVRRRPAGADCGRPGQPQ